MVQGSFSITRGTSGYNIDTETCAKCGGPVKMYSCIDDQAVIDKILAYLKERTDGETNVIGLPESRAPPQAKLFD